MIRIHRGPEPSTLQTEREARLAARLLEWHDRGQRPYAMTWTESQRQKHFRAGYKAGRTTLWRAQHKKCAYCEIQINAREDIEHFRPVNLYWWLTWSWENHFLVCGTCSGAKGTLFPLDHPDPAPVTRGPRLGADGTPDGLAERPTWVDPAAEDPRDFIIHAIDRRGPITRWAPRGIDPSGRGMRTIEDFELDDAERLDALNEHLEDLEADDELTEIRAAAARGEAATRPWRALLRRAVERPTARWRALVFDYLCAVRAELRRDHDIDLPPLADIADRRPASPPTPLFAPDPLLARLDPRAALHIRRARSPRVAMAHRRSALNALLDHQNPCPLADLRALFPNKTAQTLRDWINQTPGLTLHQNQIRRP